MNKWKTQIGVILAVMGSAIGLGNFLRFPGLAAQYEGGAFMIPYFIALLLLGLPIAWAEWGIGRAGGKSGFNSSPGIFRALWKNRASPYMGIIGLIVPVGIYMYYILIESWCLYYAWQYLKGTFPLGIKSTQAYADHFNMLVGSQANGSVLTSESNLVTFLIICGIINFIFVYRGLAKGIELICKIAIPALFACAIIVLVRVLTLGTPNPELPDQNVINGLGFMWNLHSDSVNFWKSIGNADMWLAAAGQVFFSLSVGFGVIINYASYLKKDDDLVLSAATSVSGNEFAEVALGGMITIPAAFIFLGAAGTGGGTFQLGFITLPLVFEHMPMGNIIGFLWFFLLFLAAITSSISMIQPAVAFFEEGIGLGRKTAILFLTFITMSGTALILYFSEGLTALDTFDFWIGTFAIFLFASIEVILFAWVIGIKKGMEEINQGAAVKLKPYVGFILKYISPVYLFVIFAVWSVQKMPGYITKIKGDLVSQISLAFILVFFLLLVFLTYQSVKKWDKKEDIK
jgi:SNF family Na+-dependent transporter